MIFEAPINLLEGIDETLTELMSGAPFVVALGIAALLGLRHASDPDHLVAVTSLAADDRDASGAVRLGAWWGLGHAATLLAVGLPLVLLETALPGWLESGAEKLIGAVIIFLALRLLFRWFRKRNSERERRDPIRTSREALAVGVLHGLAGTGAVVVLLLAQLPSQTAAAFALLAFAPMSVISMVACTSGFAWALTRPAVLPLYSSYVLPALGAFSLLFGAWYAGIV